MSIREEIMIYTLRIAEPAASDTFEQERREVLDSVFHALRVNPPDPDAMAACAYLVRHLTAEVTT
jgi:hypothetical protein